jgi:poly(3-hydroxybutyrate) depolymerase
VRSTVACCLISKPAALVQAGGVGCAAGGPGVVGGFGGHFARFCGTVRDPPHYEVYVTDWQDARFVPRAASPFDLDVYIDYSEFLRFFRGNVHVMAVCQPAVPVFAAVALLEAAGDRSSPRSMILMAGPIVVRENPTAVNRFAEARTLDWFRRNVITQLPWPYPGVMRMVYPGFLQLSGFMGMNFGRHVSAHRDLFHNLIQGDGDSSRTSIASSTTSFLPSWTSRPSITSRPSRPYS